MWHLEPPPAEAGDDDVTEDLIAKLDRLASEAEEQQKAETAARIAASW